MLRYDDNGQPKLEKEDLEKLVNFLHSEGQRYWKLAGQSPLQEKSEDFQKGKAMHLAAAELERAYYRLGIRI